MRPIAALIGILVTTTILGCGLGDPPPLPAVTSPRSAALLRANERVNQAMSEKDWIVIDSLAQRARESGVPTAVMSLSYFKPRAEEAYPFFVSVMLSTVAFVEVGDSAVTTNIKRCRYRYPWSSIDSDTTHHIWVWRDGEWFLFTFDRKW
jgi:hypothetical protein